MLYITTVLPQHIVSCYTEYESPTEPHSHSTKLNCKRHHYTGYPTKDSQRQPVKRHMCSKTCHKHQKHSLALTTSHL